MAGLLPTCNVRAKIVHGFWHACIGRSHRELGHGFALPLLVQASVIMIVALVVWGEVGWSRYHGAHCQVKVNTGMMF